MHNDLFNLPAGPPELCFDKNEFVKVECRQSFARKVYPGHVIQML